MHSEVNLKLGQIIDIHNSYQKYSNIKLNLCDGYLYKENFIYKNIRDTVLNLGCSFTTDDFCGYQAFFRGSLEAILKQKKIFYVDHVTVFKKLEKRHPHRLLFNDIITSTFGNAVFHESSHLICDHYFSEKLFRKIDINDSSQKAAMRIIIGEAIASTQDEFLALFNINSTMQNISKFHFGFNKVDPKKVFYNEVFDKLDFFGTYLITFMAYLHSYYLFEKVEIKNIKRVLDLFFPNLNFSSKDLKHIKSIFDHACRINKHIRTKEHNMYFQIVLKENVDVYTLCNLDFLTIFENYEKLVLNLKKMAELAQNGISKKS